jgi:hypothetical protein
MFLSLDTIIRTCVINNSSFIFLASKLSMYFILYIITLQFRQNWMPHFFSSFFFLFSNTKYGIQYIHRNWIWGTGAGVNPSNSFLLSEKNFISTVIRSFIVFQVFVFQLAYSPGVIHVEDSQSIVTETIYASDSWSLKCWLTVIPHQLYVDSTFDWRVENTCQIYRTDLPISSVANDCSIY